MYKARSTERHTVTETQDLLITVNLYLEEWGGHAVQNHCGREGRTFRAQSKSLCKGGRRGRASSVPAWDLLVVGQEAGQCQAGARPRRDLHGELGHDIWCEKSQESTKMGQEKGPLCF